MPILCLPPPPPPPLSLSYSREILQIKSRGSSWPVSYAYRERQRERESVCGWTDGKLLLDLRVDIMQMVLVVKRKTTRTKLIQMRKLTIPVPLPPFLRKKQRIRIEDIELNFVRFSSSRNDVSRSLSSNRRIVATLPRLLAVWFGRDAGIKLDRS